MLQYKLCSDSSLSLVCEEDGHAKQCCLDDNVSRLRKQGLLEEGRVQRNGEKMLFWLDILQKLLTNMQKGIKKN